MNSNYSLLIKPASYSCNLNCRYCFYLDKAELYTDSATLRMSEDTLEKIIQEYLQTQQECYHFGWQGGEPTLMGVDFFQQAVYLQNKYNIHHKPITNSLQTNATLLTDEFAEFFRKYNFLLGCSLDGSPDIHNTYRKTTQGEGTQQAVMKGIGLLKKHMVDFNILILVSKANVSKAAEVFDYLNKHQLYNQQYIPCVECDATGNLADYAITGKEWGVFLTTIFDKWYAEGLNNISIRNFDSILKLSLSGSSDVCTLSNSCNRYLVAEHNGDIYPCDFFVESKTRLANIAEQSFTEIYNSVKFRNFSEKKSAINLACKDCKFLPLCFGDCPKNRKSTDNLSHLCEGWKYFYNHTIERFSVIAHRITAHKRELASS